MHIPHVISADSHMCVRVFMHIQLLHTPRVRTHAQHTVSPLSSHIDTQLTHTHGPPLVGASQSKDVRKDVRKTFIPSALPVFGLLS